MAIYLKLFIFIWHFFSSILFRGMVIPEINCLSNCSEEISFYNLYLAISADSHCFIICTNAYNFLRTRSIKYFKFALQVTQLFYLNLLTNILNMWKFWEGGAIVLNPGTSLYKIFCWLFWSGLWSKSNWY